MLAMPKQTITLLPGETVLRRYAALQALDGQQADALDTVERPKIFATVLHDWPSQLWGLYELCDDEPKLAALKAELMKRYGVPSATSRGDDDDE